LDSFSRYIDLSSSAVKISEDSIIMKLISIR
jgi:hypothetical protein